MSMTQVTSQDLPTELPTYFKFLTIYFVANSAFLHETSPPPSRLFTLRAFECFQTPGRCAKVPRSVPLRSGKAWRARQKPSSQSAANTFATELDQETQKDVDAGWATIKPHKTAIKPYKMIKWLKQQQCKPNPIITSLWNPKETQTKKAGHFLWKKHWGKLR